MWRMVRGFGPSGEDGTQRTTNTGRAHPRVDAMPVSSNGELETLVDGSRGDHKTMSPAISGERAIHSGPSSKIVVVIVRVSCSFTLGLVRYSCYCAHTYCYALYKMTAFRRRGTDALLFLNRLCRSLPYPLTSTSQEHTVPSQGREYHRPDLAEVLQCWPLIPESSQLLQVGPP